MFLAIQRQRRPCISDVERPSNTLHNYVCNNISMRLRGGKRFAGFFETTLDLRFVSQKYVRLCKNRLKGCMHVSTCVYNPIGNPENPLALQQLMVDTEMPFA